MNKTVVMVVGVVFVILGLLAFFTDPVLGVFGVSSTLAWVYLLSGVTGLVAAFMGESNAKMFAKVFGVIYALVTVLGFVQGDSVLGLFAVNMADNVLHLVLALVLLWAGFMGGRQTMPGQM